MVSLDHTVAFFDVGNPLASVTHSPTSDRIETLTAYAYVPPVLASLRDLGVRLGIISDRDTIPAKDVNQVRGHVQTSLTRVAEATERPVAARRPARG